jgi:imidazole glycerol phosphate synthase subunit HisF
MDADGTKDFANLLTAMISGNVNLVIASGGAGTTNIEEVFIINVAADAEFSEYFPKKLNCRFKSTFCRYSDAL